MTNLTRFQQRHFLPDSDRASELVSAYGSPLYVYDSDCIRESIAHIGQSVPHNPVRFAFASVTNGNIALLKLFRDSGWALHANTPGDAFLGLKAGFLPGDIVYSGSNLTSTEFKQMLDWKVCTFNLDSAHQMELLGKCWQAQDQKKPLKLGVRLNVPEITGESRIGIKPSELRSAAQLCSRFGLSLTGIHFYRGTATNANERFSDALNVLMEAGQSLPDWQYLDFGGGFGFPYFDRGSYFDWNEFGQDVAKALKSLNRKLELIIEPGRSVLAGSACVLTTVVSVKWQGDKQIIGTDTTTANIAVLSVHGGTRRVTSFKQAGEQTFTSDICGNTTYSRDYIAKACLLPRIYPGDLLAVLDMGAYGYSMASHFLHRPKPAEVLIENQKHRLIRKRETLDCLLANQVIGDTE